MKFYQMKEAEYMKTALTREKAIGLLREYNKEPFHVLHGLTVGGVLKWYARELGLSLIHI